MADINRSAISLPPDVSQEIIQKAQEGSAVMQLSRQVKLPGRGVKIPVILGDPTAGWVAETGMKPVSNASVSTKILEPYKIAVIETFSKEFTRDAKSLYDTLVKRLPGALAACFDKTVIGAVAKPGENFDNFTNCTAQSLVATSSATAYDGLVAADTDIAVHGGIVNGYALSPQAKGILLAAKDSTGRPLFVNSAADGAIPTILGAKTYMNKGIFKAGQPGTTDGEPDIVGIAGDWSQAMYGTVEGVVIDLNTKGVVTLNAGTTSAVEINLWQQNMVAVLAEIEVGFRADTSVFNLLTGEIPAA